jgi:hypothetical protein
MLTQKILPLINADNTDSRGWNIGECWTMPKRGEAPALGESRGFGCKRA